MAIVLKVRKEFSVFHMGLTNPPVSSVLLSHPSKGI